MKQLLVTCDHCGDKYAYEFQTSKIFANKLREQGWKMGNDVHVHICPKCAENDVRPSDHTK